MTRSDRRRYAVIKPKRRWPKVLIALVVIAALAGVAVTVQELLDLEDRKEVADAATVEARAQEAVLDEQAADLEALIDRLEVVTADQLATAKGIDVAVADILHLRGKVETLTAEVATAREDRAVRQQRIDVLLGCRNTLDAAIAQLSGGHVAATGAVGVLGQGANRCQAALELAQGDTGAVHPYDFADPSVLLVGDTYYAYATEGPGGAIQVLSSKGLGSWSVRTRALANRPSWAKPGPIWAPSVHPIGGQFVLYYATRSKISSQQCISTAVSETPAGPFLDLSAGRVDAVMADVLTLDVGFLKTPAGNGFAMFGEDHLDPDIFGDGLAFGHAQCLGRVAVAQVALAAQVEEAGVQVGRGGVGGLHGAGS